MNSYIESKARESEASISEVTWGFSDQGLVIFSNALILECCRILHERHAGNNPYDSPDIMAIKEHFGIEVNAHMKDK